MRNLTQDKKTLYLVTTALLAILVLTLFIGTAYVRSVGAVVLATFAFTVHYTVKKRSILSFYKTQVLMLLTVIAVFYLILLYISGIYFGYAKSYPTLSFNSIIYYVLPSVITIFSVEKIRSVLLAQGDKVINVLTFTACVAAELLISSAISSISSFNKLMDLICLTLFPAVTANILYNHVSRRYGAMPNIVFRLIFSLYAYVVPIVPYIPSAIHAFVKLLYPLLAYLFISGLYVKKRRYALKRSSKIGGIITALTFAVMIAIIMVVSCQFKYGMIVIATDSMTGEINVGDAIVYESYTNQYVNEGDIIVFDRDGAKIVHRVEEIERINDVNRYYTKGDNNDVQDAGFITESDIVGIVKFKVAMMGQPTLWIKGLFK